MCGSPVQSFPEVFLKIDFDSVPFSPSMITWKLISSYVQLRFAVNQMISKVSSSSEVVF